MTHMTACCQVTWAMYSHKKLKKSMQTAFFVHLS